MFVPFLPLISSCSLLSASSENPDSSGKLVFSGLAVGFFFNLDHSTFAYINQLEIPLALHLRSSSLSRELSLFVSGVGISDLVLIRLPSVLRGIFVGSLEICLHLAKIKETYRG